MFAKSIRIRIAMAQVFLLSSILGIAAFLQLIPNDKPARQQSRKKICETLAVNTAVLVTHNDVSGVRAALASVVGRDEEMLSAALRDRRGQIVARAGDHAKHWNDKLTAEEFSVETQVIVPIHAGTARWGRLEICFAPLTPPGWLGYIQNPMVRLIAFVSTSAFLVNYFYFATKLRDLDPSRAAPRQVREAYDALTEGLLLINQRHRIILANQALADNVGVDPEELFGKPIDSLPWIPLGEDRRQTYPWVRATESKRLQMGALLGLKRAGGDKILNVHAVPLLGPSGTLLGVMVTFEDITELEKARVELRKSKEAADAANRAKSDFLANMSHEIRTPMNAILGFTDVMRRGMATQEEQRHDYLNTIHASGKHLLSLINDILDLSKIEAGKMELELTPCSPHQLLAEVVSVLKVRADEKGIYLRWRTDGGLPETIMTDPTRVRQLVTNLAGNAIKFTEQGGVEIVARLVRTGGPPKIAISVTDTGIGMTAEQVEKVFDPFTQADESVTRKFGGTGLGLSISKRFAEALGGGISATSKPGKGSTFTAMIETGPLKRVQMISDDDARKQEQQVTQTVGIDVALPPSRILVADDVEANRKLINLVLTSAGAELQLACNGQEAYEMARDGDFDVIIMDMQMPVMDGFTAVRKLRDAGFTKPILALTADAMKGSEERCREAGCSGFLTKPIDLDKVLHTVGEVLREVNPQRVRKTPEPPPPAAPSDEERKLEELLREEMAKPDPETSQDIDLQESPPANETASNSSTEPPQPNALNAPDDMSQSMAIDIEALREIAAEYLPHLQEQIDEIGRIWGERDYDELAQLAHSIKGSAGTFGLDEFTQPAAELQQLAQAKAGDAEIEDKIRLLRALGTRADRRPDTMSLHDVLLEIDSR